ncbi:hypothetical protein MYX84_03895 [Acidobacteria bacterium AH-259-O06]|nr:hypothetical protein [Acidobacteria bacterium AH-259-O06]
MRSPLVKNIGQSNSSFPSQLTALSGALLFTADDRTHGEELWKSDGTEAGTVLVKDIRPGSDSSSPSELTNVNGTLFFEVARELWKSNGTESGTLPVKAFLGPPSQLTNVTGTLFFVVAFRAPFTLGLSELWKSDGTEAGTVALLQTPGGVRNLTNVNATLFFTFGIGMWKSDGTQEGTVLVKSFYVSACCLTNVRDTLFLAANDGTNGHELWKSDGTEGGTVLAKDILLGPDSSSPSQLTNVDGMLFFVADDGINGRELWKSDGTAEGTVLVRDILPGSDSSSPSQLTNVNGMLFFVTDDSINGRELWRSDGTGAGTVLVKDMRLGPDSSSPSALTNINGTLFFSADDGINGRELWKSDGTKLGTVLVQDIAPGPLHSQPSDLALLDSLLFFSANDHSTGFELWALRPEEVVSGGVLYFPFYQANGSTFVGFAVSNFLDQTANLEFSAFAADGSLYSLPNNPASFTLEPESQFAQLGSEIFGVDPSTPQAGWVELSTDNVQIGSFFQFGNPSLTQLDGSVAFSEQAKKLYFTRVFEGQSAFRGQAAKTLLSIANPNDDPITVELKLLGPRGELAPQQSEVIAGKGFLFKSVSELLGDVPVSSGYIEAEVIQGGGAVGFELIQLLDHTTIIGVNASFGNPSTESFSAQLASATNIFTNLKVVNVSDTARAITVTAITEDGSNLAPPATVNLGPGELLEKDVRELFGLDPSIVSIGSIRVEADGAGVIGDVIFGDPDSFNYAASMPLQTQKFRHAIFSQVANGLGFFTGLALYNPNMQTADVTIQVFSHEGQMTGEQTLQLSGGQRISQLVSELIPSTAEQVRGYIVIQSNQPLIAQQLFGDNGLNLLSAVPPTIVQ